MYINTAMAQSLRHPRSILHAYFSKVIVGYMWLYAWNCGFLFKIGY